MVTALQDNCKKYIIFLSLIHIFVLSLWYCIIFATRITNIITENMKQTLTTIIVVLSALVLMPRTGFAQDVNEVNDWPDLPLLTIETVDHVMPTATVVYPPEGGVGTGIISDYVQGHLTITLNGKNLYDSGDYVKGESGIRLKIRGNSTGAYLDQHPYKIKLSKKADLLFSDKKTKSKDWALLSIYMGNQAMKNGSNNIIVHAGLALGQALDFPWTPRTRPVNVVINGEYQGLYHLIETVERADERVKTDKSGFLIEDDAYWWKPGETYFKTDRQHPSMGFTFKYPDPDDMSEERFDAVKNFMNSAEEAIFEGKGAEYVDYESFARWLLCHDILGTSDTSGSNLFMYKESLGDDDTSCSKLKMATPWDFDTSFCVSDDTWGVQHISTILFFSELLKDKDFAEKYLEVYDKYKDKVYPYLDDYFKSFKENYGEAFEKSMVLHGNKYKECCKNTLDEQIDDILAHFKVRLATMETLTQQFRDVLSSVKVASRTEKSMVRLFDIYGTNCSSMDEKALRPGIYIEQYSDGTTRKVYK